MNPFKNIHPLIIYSLCWTISMFFFFNGLLQGESPDFSFFGVVRSLVSGTIIGAAQFYFIPGNRVNRKLLKSKNEAQNKTTNEIEQKVKEFRHWRENMIKISPILIDMDKFFQDIETDNLSDDQEEEIQKIKNFFDTNFWQ